jgi:BolA family transcriptional regulator, general stress-responsive regulator
MKTADRLTEDLRAAFAPEHVEVEDESSRHKGHAGAMEGGHYNALIVSTRFEGLGLVDRHRTVYAARGDLAARRVHALALRTYTPEEWRQQRV